uniref:CmlA1-like leader peptide n=1 Tax=Escherichia coli TaxID=562 RepID=F5CIA4_ECOLX|nr:cmlA1-like leader peptide [Escherichia coli]
MSISKNADK